MGEGEEGMGEEGAETLLRSVISVVVIDSIFLGHFNKEGAGAQG